MRRERAHRQGEMQSLNPFLTVTLPGRAAAATAAATAGLLVPACAGRHEKMSNTDEWSLECVATRMIDDSDERRLG